MNLSIDKFIAEEDEQGFMLSWSGLDKDTWVAENVGLSRVKAEAELFHSKWFDYRHLHPMDATILFAEAYKKEYAAIMGSHGREDYRKAPFKTGLKRVPFIRLSKTNITSLWKARQKADELGVEYGYFISSILSIAAKREWRELPRPQHLWQDDLLEIFTDKHNRRKGTRLDGSLMDYFTTSMYSGDEIQKAHRKYILAQIMDALPRKRYLMIFSAAFLAKYIDKQFFEMQFPNDYRKACKLV
ncbi:hypothetical protein L9H26_19195 [Morganella psychrotolerans]|uniref:Uncharacterized protein n=1 Tax=Morganella psychrotolerans TaxID=368603 RepID=A0A5M9QZP1_9GAMM|nr:hypothetical protein [Morganella psychrotolerans]KAA8713026.1 hypothetical protein F4V73_18090 [Morganella psychrotolerans]OBU01878.1 hypothetical protein AYY16_16815 [Morganella psychrotolerans]